MKFTRIPEDTFKELQLNAGVLMSTFTPHTEMTASAIAEALIGATTGGINFSATPSFSDFGADIDNCPKNMKELKKLDTWETKMSGTFVTITAASTKRLMSAADIDTTDTSKITPRNDLLQTDFQDIWWVGDYSDKNGDTGGGFLAIHMLNSLSTGGFQIKSTDKGKGQFSFEFTGHYSISNQNTVPFEVYVQAGTAEGQTQGGNS